MNKRKGFPSLEEIKSKCILLEGHWLWTGSKITSGYGFISRKNTGRLSLHRYTKIIHDKLPLSTLKNEKLFFMHKCDLPSCVNPEHIEIGNAKLNYDDSVKKRRHSHGSKHGISKLTESDVREIKKLLRDNKFSHRKIANLFSVSSGTIGAINIKKTWKHISI